MIIGIAVPVVGVPKQRGESHKPGFSTDLLTPGCFQQLSSMIWFPNKKVRLDGFGARRFDLTMSYNVGPGL